LQFEFEFSFETLLLNNHKWRRKDECKTHLVSSFSRVDDCNAVHSLRASSNPNRRAYPGASTHESSTAD
jgi:hypothetical protein